MTELILRQDRDGRTDTHTFRWGEERDALLWYSHTTYWDKAGIPAGGGYGMVAGRFNVEELIELRDWLSIVVDEECNRRYATAPPMGISECDQ